MTHILYHQSTNYDNYEASIVASDCSQRLEDFINTLRRNSEIYLRIQNSYVKPQCPEYPVPMPSFEGSWRELGYDLESNDKERRKAENIRWTEYKRAKETERSIWTMGYLAFRAEFEENHVKGTWERHVANSILPEDGISAEDLLSFFKEYPVVFDDESLFIRQIKELKRI